MTGKELQSDPNSELPVASPRRRHRSRIGAGFLAVIAACGGWLLVMDDNTPKVEVATEVPAEESPTNAPVVIEAETTTTTTEVTTTTSAPPPEPALIYATKTGTKVNVYRLDLGALRPETLFTYDDYQAELERWSEYVVLPPDIALSPDRRTLAYVAVSGLRARDLLTGEDRVLIGRKETPRPDGGADLEWSIEQMNGPDHDGIWDIGDLRWSPNGRYLSFSAVMFEAQSTRVLDVATGQLWRGVPGDVLTWSPDGATIVGSGPFFADDGELNVRRLGGYAVDLAQRIGPPRRGFRDVALSPRADLLAIVYSEGPQTDYEPHRIGFLRPDGSHLRPVDNTDQKQAVTFTPDGTAVIWVERRLDGAFLMRADVKDGMAREVRRLPAGFLSWSNPVWTEHGDLSLTGRTPAVSPLHRLRRIQLPALWRPPDGVLHRPAKWQPRIPKPAPTSSDSICGSHRRTGTGRHLGRASSTERGAARPDDTTRARDRSDGHDHHSSAGANDNHDEPTAVTTSTTTVAASTTSHTSQPSESAPGSADSGEQ